jgi:hypothetical protein
LRDTMLRIEAEVLQALDGPVCCMLRHPAVRDTVPCGIRCRAGYGAVRDTAPCGIPRRAGYRAVRAAILSTADRQSLL